jgi:hypothetical protein
MYTPTISQATKAAVVYDSGRPVSLRRVLRPYARARCETHPRQAADWEDVIAKRLSHSASLPILQSTDAYGRWQRLCQLTDGARAGTHPTQTHHAHWPWTGTAYVFHRLSPALIEASWPGFKGLTMKLAGK